MEQPETNVVQLSYGRDFDVRYAAMIYDALAMLIDSGDYEDELIEWAIQRQEAYSRSVLSLTQQRLIEGHRKVPSLT